MPKISIVIITFNGKSFIKSCLDSICAQNYWDFEVIVVDNNSKDGTVDSIKENYPQVILIENKQNLGVVKARNQGIEIARGGWILTLDCDVILEKGFLRKMLYLLEKTDKSVGILQPKVLNMDKKTIYSCGIYLSKLIRFYDIGKGKFDDGQFNVPKYIFGACSAAALYNRQMLEEIKEDTGYFDEKFFFLVEDVDLSWRAQRKGWKALFYPEVICYHFGNSSQSSKKIRQYLCWRNRKLLLKKSRLNRFNLSVTSLLYDFVRLFFLFLTNFYVRNEIKNRRGNLDAVIGGITGL